MDVIGHPTDGERGSFVRARDAAEIRPKAALNVRRQDRLAAFCAPDAMIQAACKCVHQVISSAVPAGLADLLALNPPLKRRAIFFRPTGLEVWRPPSFELKFKLMVSFNK